MDVHYGRVCGCALWEGVRMCIMGGCMDVHYGRVHGCALWEGMRAGACVKIRMCEGVKVCGCEGGRTEESW